MAEVAVGEGEAGNEEKPTTRPHGKLHPRSRHSGIEINQPPAALQHEGT
jgi:hypothetical protein